MKRNTGLIGGIRSSTVQASPGVFDTFDVYNLRRLNRWPATIFYNSLSLNSGNIFENTTQSITLNTTGIVSNTTLFWTILNGTSLNSDFSGSVTSGSFTQSAATNTGSFSITTAFTGNTGKTPRTFQIQIRTGSTSGPIVYTSGVYTIPAITISTLSWSPTTVNEGSSASLSFQCGNCGTSNSFSFTLSNSGTITAADISGGLPTSTTRNPGNLTSVSYTLLADETTEGTETWTTQLSFGGFNLGSAQTLTVSDTSVTPVLPTFVTAGTKAPTFGAGGAATYPPAGWTGLQNVNADDAFVTITSPFSVTINGTAYTSHFMGSNTYITWGTGRTEYSSLSASNPPQNKLMMGAADNSYQRVSTFTSGTAYTRIRYEGNGSTSGTLGSPGIVLEITFFNPANYGGVPVIEVLGGNHNRTSGVTGIATTNAFMLTWTTTANSAYVLVGNSTGTTWTRYNGFVNNSGY